MAIHCSILAWRRDRGVWRATVHGVARVAESDMTKVTEHACIVLLCTIAVLYIVVYLLHSKFSI